MDWSIRKKRMTGYLLTMLLVTGVSSCKKWMSDDFTMVGGETEAVLHLEIFNGDVERSRAATTVDPTVEVLAPEAGKGKENELASVRVLVFDDADVCVANELASFYPHLSNGNYNATVKFTLERAKGLYSILVIANESMLEEASQLLLRTFHGTRDELQSLPLWSTNLQNLALEESYITMFGESATFDLEDATKYRVDPTTGRSYYQINEESRPIKVERICSKVELMITNENSADNPTYENRYKIVELRRQDVRTQSPLYSKKRIDESFIGEDISTSYPVHLQDNQGGTIDFGEVFTIQDSFYAGTYRQGNGFRNQLDEPLRGASTSYYMKLVDINGTEYEYILPIGDLLKNKNGELSGTLMERNIIYRINGYITGKDLRLVLMFGVAKEKEETLAPIPIYPRNKG